MKRFEITWKHRAVIHCRNKEAAMRRFEEFDYGKLDARKNKIEEHRFVALESFVCLDDGGISVSADELNQSAKLEAMDAEAQTTFAVDLSAPIPAPVMKQVRALPQAARSLLISLEYRIVEEGDVFDTAAVRKLRSTFKEDLGLYQISPAQEHNRHVITLSGDGWLLAWACRYLRAQALWEANPVPAGAQKRVGTSPVKRKRAARKKTVARKAAKKKTVATKTTRKTTRKRATRKAARRRRT